MNEILQLEWAESGHGEVDRNNDGFYHCKIVPYLIVAQAWEGHYEIACGDDAPLVLAEGEAFVAPPNTYLKIRHRINPDTGAMRMRWLHIRASFFGAPAPGKWLELPRRLTRADSCRAGECIEAFAAAETCPERLGRELGRRTAALTLLSLLYERSVHSPDREAAWAAEYRRLAPALPLLHATNATNEWTIGQLAARCGMSRAVFYRRFVNLLGVPPAEYRLKQRIARAAELFAADHTRSVKEVSECCGFANAFHFSRKFKQCLGVPPRQFRQNLMREATLRTR